MPKSNFLRKKSKTGATADFKRLKAKVGKRAPQAASHTDTSFKSKRVRVSAQSILHELGDGDAVTARGQGVQELLVQLRHYSPASKREALAGLKTIVDRYRSFAEVNFARLAEASLELAVFFDNDVRKALLTFQEALLGCVSARTFSPFANLYMAYVVSAMTSLDGGVRRDSLKLLALLLARFPAAVADRAERVAPNYTILLAVDPASKKQTGRSEALESLVSMFRAVSLRFGRGGGGGVARADGSLGSGKSGSNLGSANLSWKRGSRRNGALMLCPCAAPGAAGSATAGSDGGDGVGAKVDAPVKSLASILPQLLERLKDIWMEALAAVPPDVGLMQNVVNVLLEAIASPAWTIFGGGDGGGAGIHESGGACAPGAISRHDATGRVGKDGGGPGDSTSVWFSQFVPLVLEVFPMRPLEGELLGDVEAEHLHAIESLNMGLCELVVAACTGPAAITTAAASGVGVAKSINDGEDPSDWLAPVLAHVHEVLREGVGSSRSDALQIPSVLRVLRAATYNATPKSSGFVDWTLQRQRLLSAFGDFLESLPPRAETKVLCVRFVCNLTSTMLADSTARGGQTTVRDDPGAAQEVCRWLQALPELLCRWEGDFPESSAAALGALVEVAKHAPAPPPATGNSSSSHGDERIKGKAATGSLAASTRLGGGGAWATASSELLRSIEPALLGEFFSGRGFLLLPSSAQMDAISLLYHLPSVPLCVVSVLAAACSDPAALHRNVRSFVLEVMHHRRRILTPSAYLGFLVGVLTGSTGVTHLGGAKRAAGRSGAAGGGGRDGGGKRRRQQSTADGSGIIQEEYSAPVEAPPEHPTLWDTVFGRDEVTGAVCNSLAMVGTRGGKLLEALRPTLLQLLRPGSERGGATGGGGEHGKVARGGGALLQMLDEDSLATALQGQRAAMACVLCCWEGLDVESSAAPASAKTASPLSALERPMAVACVWAMKTAGTAEAAEKARGARLLRPVLVLVKRWPALLPLILTLIVDATSEVTAAAVDGEGAAAHDVDSRGSLRSLEPSLRCVQAVVREPGLQGQLRRRHLGVLRAAARTLCEALDGSPLKDVVVQLRADVDLLGGCAE